MAGLISLTCVSLVFYGFNKEGVDDVPRILYIDVGFMFFNSFLKISKWSFSQASVMFNRFFYKLFIQKCFDCSNAFYAESVRT